jgi:hypothetical protein
MAWGTNTWGTGNWGDNPLDVSVNLTGIELTSVLGNTTYSDAIHFNWFANFHFRNRYVRSNTDVTFRIGLVSSTAITADANVSYNWYFCWIA